MSRMSTARPVSPMEIVLPATSANLGPAFDTAAIALRLHLRVRARLADQFSVDAHGRDTAHCGRLKHNLLLETYREILQSAKKEPPPLAIRMDNGIPVGKGLGSSAAARLAGVALAVHFGALHWSSEQILDEAARREQHADNVAACWLGGIVLVHSNGHGGSVHEGIGALKLRTRGNWRLLLAVTATPLSTERARAVLPDHYSRCDAVANLQSAMLLTAALLEGRSDLLRHALRDRIHEPYRGPLCPLLAPLRSLAGNHGVLGAVLSGAGPSVLVILDSRVPVTTTQRRVAKFLRERGLNAELLLTSIEPRGARDRFKISVTRFASVRDKQR
jgi:homoserine kinase